MLFRQGATTRADLAQAWGLTRSTTGSLVQSLVETGFARKDPEGSEEAETRVGPPGILVEIGGDGAFFIGVDRPGRRTGYPLKKDDKRLRVAGVLAIDPRHRFVWQDVEAAGRHRK